ncbi:MAG: EAL domain-containing protein [Campylobacterales bacterium]|nr:EAL domain-containing protein [Campylobacterales bacterium]
MNYPEVGNIASKTIIYLDINAILDEAIKLITQKSVRNIVVHDQDSDEYAYIGVDEVVHYITANTDVNTSLVKLGLHPLISIPKSYNIFEASYFFIENEAILGVLDDDGELCGVLSFIDILSATMNMNENLLFSPVRSLVYKNSALMTKRGVKLNSLLKELDSVPTDCIVVHEDEVPIGLITKRDITAMVARGESLSRTVDECMNSPVFTVNEDLSVRDALNTINQYKYKRILVVDDTKKLQGIITQKELISIIYHRFSHKAIMSMEKLNNLLEQKVNIKTEEISELKDRYEYALAASSDGIWDWNIVTGQVIVSKQLKEMLRLERRYICCMSDDYEKLIHPDDRKRVFDERAYMMEAKEDIYDTEYRILSGDEYIWIKNRSKIVYYNSQAIRIVSTVSNITKYKQMQQELKLQEEKLIYQANHDSLTNLPNRKQLLQKLDEKTKYLKDEGSCFGVLFIDLDRFKEINDSLGHIVGDMVLEIISKKLKDTISKKHLISRFGGDEFVVITDTLENKIDAAVIAQSIIDAMIEPIIISNHTLYISSSIGISLYPKDAKNSQNLLKHADAAMFRAKEDGLNSYAFYNSHMTKDAIKKVELESDIHKALLNDEFEVYYQPQYDMQLEKIVGAEALVRWNHPTKGMISPDEFIPFAEQTGVIIKLDQVVMKKAMKQFSIWHEKGYEAGVLSLNLAMKQLQHENFIEMLKGHIKEFEFESKYLELEITESQVMKDPLQSISKLREVSDAGIKIAIDDFGTGYSSLAYLKKLPVHKLKIDRSFIGDIPNDDEDIAITSSIIALAHSLKLKVIAEGVESKEQSKFLLQKGCKLAQGYYYSKPLKASDFEVLLKKFT